MNYYEVTSKVMRLIQNLHRLDGDMEFIQTVGVGPFEVENCVGEPTLPDIHLTIHEQLTGWMSVTDCLFAHANVLAEKMAEAQEQESLAVESLFSESEMRKKEIKKLKRNIELKNERIKKLKKDIEDRIERKTELKINSN